MVGPVAACRRDRPTLSDAELVTPTVMSALLGYTSERRRLRRVERDFGHLFPYVPQQSGYNKRLRAASSLITSMIRILARDTTLWSDDVWLVDSTPVGRGCSRETAKRSDLAGRPQYGYRASHSRYFRGLRLHLVCTLGSLPMSRSTRPSQGNSTWNDTAARAQQGSQSVSCAGSSHSQRRSDTTIRLSSPSSDH